MPQAETGSGQPFPVHVQLEGLKDQCTDQVVFAEPLLGPGLLGTEVEPLETEERPFHFFLPSV